MNFLDLVTMRHSVRNYETRAVEKEKLDYVLECVRPRDWMENVPCIIVACANHEESWHRKSDGKDHADIDVAIAVEHLCLAATEQGLGTCWVCNFDVPLCREVLCLPDSMEPVVMIPMGYAKEQEVQTKKRKSLDEILF